MANQKFTVAINAVPMTTAQRDAYTPDTRDLIYNTDDNRFQYFDGVKWISIIASESGNNFADIWAANTLMNC